MIISAPVVLVPLLQQLGQLELPPPLHYPPLLPPLPPLPPLSPRPPAYWWLLESHQGPLDMASCAEFPPGSSSRWFRSSHSIQYVQLLSCFRMRVLGAHHGEKAISTFNTNVGRIRCEVLQLPPDSSWPQRKSSIILVDEMRGVYWETGLPSR